MSIIGGSLSTNPNLLNVQLNSDLLPWSKLYFRIDLYVFRDINVHLDVAAYLTQWAMMLMTDLLRKHIWELVCHPSFVNFSATCTVFGKMTTKLAVHCLITYHNFVTCVISLVVHT